MKQLLIITNTMGRAGAERALISLLRCLDYSRVSVSLLAIIGRGEMFAQVPPQVKILNRNPSTGPVRGHRFLPVKLLWRLLAYTAPVPQEEYDLAIAFLEGAATYCTAGRISAKAKMAFVHVNLEKAGYPRHDAVYYREMDYICCVSVPVRDAFARMFPSLSPKLRIFENIIDKSEIITKAALPGGFDDDFDGIRIVTVARLHRQKGLDILLHAIAMLDKNIRLYIIGEGEERAKLRRLIKKLGLVGKAYLFGSCENPFPFVKQAMIYIQPSRFEGLSLSLMEAIILEKPCITTDFDGLPALLKNGKDALIVKPDATQIAAALKTLIEDADLRAALSEGTKHVPLNFPNKTAILYEIMEGRNWL